jgi:cytoskeletal protein CcmA (bactofilin family)
MGMSVMNMDDRTNVPSGARTTLDTVEGDLTVGRHAVISGSGPSAEVKVQGTIYCQGNDLFECSVSAERLEAEGDLVVRGNMTIAEDVQVEDGRVEVSGNLTSGRVDVDESLYVGQSLQADKVDVGGSLKVDGKVKIASVDVGGSFVARGDAEIGKVDVGGSVRLESESSIQELDVGGTARLARGKVFKIDVGGSLESTGALEFERIDVGGTVRLGSKSKGGNIDVGGSLRVDGDLEFDEIEVGGRVEIAGTAVGKEIDVGGTVKVGESLKIVGNLEVGGRIEVRNEVSAKTIEVGGVLNAGKATAEESIRVGGAITTKDGAMGRYVEIGRRGRVQGPIRAERAVIGKDAHVDDIHGKDVLLETGAEAHDVYGESVTIESHCRINGEVGYTGDLRLDHHASLAREPKKMDSLPE